MRRLAAMILCLTLAQAAFAQELLEKKLETVRETRIRNGPAAASDLIDKLLPDADASEKAALRLLKVRTLLDLADPITLHEKVFAAKDAFDQRSKINNDIPPVMSLEHGELCVLAAKLKMLTPQLRKVDAAAKDKAAADARAIYDAADRHFDLAIKGYRKRRKLGLAGSAQLCRAKSLLAKAETLKPNNGAQMRQRAMIVADAAKLCDEVVKNPEPRNVFMAHALLAKCAIENQDPVRIAEHLERVVRENGADAAEASRIAFYHDILYVRAVPVFNGDRAKALVERAAEWLRTYPAARNSLEGAHLRYEMAHQKLKWAGEMCDNFDATSVGRLGKDAKQRAAFEKLLDESMKLARGLVDDRTIYWGFANEIVDEVVRARAHLRKEKE